MSLQNACTLPVRRIKEPKNLSERIAWLREYYLKGAGRAWNNEFTAWTTGTPWDELFDEMTFYIVPETYPFLQTFRMSFRQAARPVRLHEDFWRWSIAERRAWFVREVMVRYVPQEILPGDLLCGARFNVQTSLCLSEDETKERNRLLFGKNGVRDAVKWFHDHGYGNCGATSGHLIPDYPRVLRIGWKGIHEEISSLYEALGPAARAGEKGAQLRAMMTACTMPRDLASRYAALCEREASRQRDPARKSELLQMAANLKRVPWEPARTFWEAVQALWLTHMLVMSDENYPGPGVSF
ncbi:MAG TPA: pyruvate formate lyase family protein, partial [Deltaproteobacteria bacterium]|nr:pyruvate formate lyase family protein [Deltaproteobacteria bacterium]